jgi:uroporphyrin-III C-methyltransferase
VVVKKLLQTLGIRATTHEATSMGVTGKVWLVGAGPGSPDLITLRGLRLLRTADVILYDALVAPELLAETRADAELLSVGKRGYCVGSTRQETIHDALVERAQRGLNVVRLKGGDPCVFGRGGEEAEYLAEHGIAFEIVPGVTTAVGACAAANIPLTHREAGQAIALVTGHFDPDSDESKLDWPALATLSNIVIYMGLRHIERITQKLLAAGMSATTPAAVIEKATTHTMRIVDGELATIASLTRAAFVEAPAIIVIGEAVRFRQRLLDLAEQNLSHPPHDSTSFQELGDG